MIPSPLLSLADHQAMHRAGWCVDLHEDGFRLQRIPATTQFKDDAAVWLHVFDLAYEEDELAVRTLAFLREHGPFEFGLIARYVAIFRVPAIAHLRERARTRA